MTGSVSRRKDPSQGVQEAVDNIHLDAPNNQLSFNSEKNQSKLSSETPIDFSVTDLLSQEVNLNGKSEPDNGFSEKEKDSKKQKEKDDLAKVGFFELFRFATPVERLFMFLGSISAAANGSALPIMTIVFSAFIKAFYKFVRDYKDDGQKAKDELTDSVNKNSVWFIIMGVSVFVLSYLQMTLWMIAGERQAKRIRILYYSSILRQDIAWFDSISTGDLTTRISGDVTLLQEGISEKIGFIIQYVTTFIAGFVIAFTKGWKLSLVLTSVIPLLVAAGGAMAYGISNSAVDGQDAYGAAGAVAEQVFGGIRTVVAFAGERREIVRYKEKLQIAYKVGVKKALISGIGMGAIMGILFSTYGLAFWYGAKLVVNGELTGDQVLNVFFAIIIGAFSLGNASPNFSSVGNALGAAAKLFAMIDRVPPIDSASEQGKILVKSDVRGQIEFKNINFHYPQRPDVPILKNFNLTIEAGQTVALVGSSGSGKSTIISLLERFYDPISGSVSLDGVDLKNVNIQSLRTQIGLVGQEPVLFPESIAQNIKWGGISDGPEPTLEEVIEASKKANAHEFVIDLPDQYNSMVGEKGALLSGGQKQRIAIARALIKDPAILLLDEATSALDTESERLVQDALDAASTNRTTVVVAHRLSTIKNADKIVVMQKGEIMEIGRHDELIEREGIYYGLVKAQELKTKRDAHDDNDSDDEESISSQNGETIIEMDEKKKQFLRRMSTKASTVKSNEEIIADDYEQKSKEKLLLIRVFKMNLPEWPIIIFGILGAAVNGAIMPLFSLVFSTILQIFSKTDDLPQMRKDANFWAAMFVVLAGVALVANFLQMGLFSISGERLTKRVRALTFEAIIRQEIAFFDEEKNSTGALTSKLATDASKVEGLTGGIMGSIISLFSNTVTGLVIAFVIGWKLAAVVLASSPAIVASGLLQMKALAGYGASTRKAYEQSGGIVQQSVSNMRTISALTREGTFKRMYEESLEKPHKMTLKGSIYSSIGFGLSQGLLFFVWTLAFWYGSRLLGNQEYTLEQMLRVLFAIIFTAMSLGQLSAFAPNTAKAKISAISIFEILDRRSKIDTTENEGKERPTPVTGEVSISLAKFNYPARPETKILRGLDMRVKSGKTVALVGGSGSGKSTVVSLLLRYYDVLSGSVKAEGVDVRDWNLEYLRSNMAIVGQEPVLFDLTIGENIAYGKEGCTQKEIEAAAKDANIHNFISSLPLGYNTPVGEKGTQLSGGQKQRVAIARALIRNPKLLLLDEATSALDSESEKVVQNALDLAAKGRTTVTIAHRLSTIQNADLILVVKKGKVIEQGKHLDLIQQHGLYYELVNKQTLTHQ
ncbi:hypothetical protein G9A89_005672 [Geosiphon pyriformis]|nr:hypothetical protein G9A89_005672 [Geosiphon pyriformis]